MTLENSQQQQKPDINSSQTIDNKRQSPFQLGLATLDDLEDCLKLALEIPKENEFDFFPEADVEAVHDTIKELIGKQCLITYHNNGVIVGIMGVTIEKFWWTKNEVMTDVLFYIKPDFRSFTAYKRMLSAAEAFAKLNKLPLALLFFSTKDLDKKYQMILRRGYKTVGFFVMRTDF